LSGPRGFDKVGRGVPRPGHEGDIPHRRKSNASAVATSAIDEIDTHSSTACDPELVGP
jgi:hypothetical protein